MLKSQFVLTECLTIDCVRREQTQGAEKSDLFSGQTSICILQMCPGRHTTQVADWPEPQARCSGYVGWLALCKGNYSQLDEAGVAVQLWHSPHGNSTTNDAIRRKRQPLQSRWHMSWTIIWAQRKERKQGCQINGKSVRFGLLSDWNADFILVYFNSAQR